MAARFSFAMEFGLIFINLHDSYIPTEVPAPLAEFLLLQ